MEIPYLSLDYDVFSLFRYIFLFYVCEEQVNNTSFFNLFEYHVSTFYYEKNYFSFGAFVHIFFSFC